MKRYAVISGFLVFLFLSAKAFASEDIEFKLEFPPLPYPPTISDVTNSAAVTDSFTVYAKIEGSTQIKAVCVINGQEVSDPNSEPLCEEQENWQGKTHPDVNPNPPEIKLAKIYYFANGESTTCYVTGATTGPCSTTMTYDSGTKLWKADIPLTNLVLNDVITYYIIASDSFGNVASQVPDPTNSPCSSSSGWGDPTLETPSLNSCTYAAQYIQCGKVKSGTPSPCSTKYTMNDITGDTCGPPDSNGNQSIVAGMDKIDLHGISAGADANKICVKLGLGAPTTSDTAPIDAYAIAFFNPDIADPNPYDTHITNLYGIHYAPEAQSSDPTLVRVLWDVGCLTNPNNEDAFACKLLSALPGDSKLSMGYDEGSLRVHVNKSGTGYNLIGSSSKLSQILAISAAVNLAGGGAAFWLVDQTQGLGFYHTNQNTTLQPPTEIAPPLAPSTLCKNPDGTSAVCPKSTTQPANNTCAVSFFPTPDKNFALKYKIYRVTKKSDLTDTNKSTYYTGEVSENGSASYSYSDTIASADLDGKIRYYALTSVSTPGTGDLETKITKAVWTTCTPEDWKPPTAPTLTSAKTPTNATNKCKIQWTADTNADTSLTGFYVFRGTDMLNTNPVGAAPGVTEYEYTDSSSILVNGESYTYLVRAEDRGANTTDSTTINCTPEDLEPPDKITSLIITKVSGVLGVKASWNPNEEEDLGGYNVHYCQRTTDMGCPDATGCCSKEEEYNTLCSNVSTSDTPSCQVTNVTNPGTFPEEGKYCFYVDAFDTCNDDGTCPSNAGESNSSGFPDGGCDSTMFTKKINVDVTIDSCYPKFPPTPTVEAPTEGNSCKITWDEITGNYNVGADCTDPFTTDENGNIDPKDLVAYMVMMKKDSGADIPKPKDDPPGVVCNRTINEPVLECTIEKDPKTGSPLTNGQKYYFLVYGVDSSENYSAYSSTPDGVECTPTDLKAPNAPQAELPDYDPISCTPKWQAVTDKDPVKYGVYRCTGKTTSCTSATQFTTTVATDLASTELSKQDATVTTNVTYTYCMTAKDPSGNESAKISSGNCAQCTPSDKPKPPSNADATGVAPTENTIAKIWWTKSADDAAGTGNYNIYRCTGETEDTCDTSSTGKVNTDGYVSGAKTSADPYKATKEPDGTWYYGITYANESDSESDLAVTANSVTIQWPDPCLADPDSCPCEITIPPIYEIKPDLPLCEGTYCKVAKSNLKIEVVDNTGTALKIGTTDSDGISISFPESDIPTGKTFDVRIILPLAPGMPCDKTEYTASGGTKCVVILKKAITEEVLRGICSGDPLPVPAIDIGTGRKDIGNADCDGEVGFNDLKELKKSYKKNVGSGADEWADFDGDGEVGFNDLKILKKNYKMIVYGADQIDTSDQSFCKPE
ncbi:MAG: hypothetical protein AB1546_14225 [bacterium]